MFCDEQAKGRVVFANEDDRVAEYQVRMQTAEPSRKRLKKKGAAFLPPRNAANNYGRIGRTG
jgi:hypothetical protein